MKLKEYMSAKKLNEESNKLFTIKIVKRGTGRRKSKCQKEKEQAKNS